MASLKDSGVHQRNTALEHIELHKLDGVLYFADDDNLYSLELFQSLRQIMYTKMELFSTMVSSKNLDSIAEPCPHANLDWYNMGTSVNETRTLAHLDPCNNVLRY